MFPVVPLLLLALLPSVFGHIATYNWEVTWVNANPDGFPRPVIGINGQWPCPPIEVNKGDRVIINLSNKLGNETTSLHFHGLFQTGTNAMDGPVGITQCPIMPGQTLKYDFVVNQVGSFWYHAHNGGSYMDGLRGPFIIRDPSPPFTYDEEVTLTVSDWYHDQAPGLVNFFQSQANEQQNGGAEPIPNTALIQDTQNAKIVVKPRKTYLFHIINMGGFVGSYLKIDGHKMKIVEIDGIYTEPKQVDEIYLTVAQRYSVLIETKDNQDKNFLISSRLDTEMFDSVPDWAKPDVYGFLMYSDKKPLPEVKPIADFTVVDDITLTPRDRQPAYEKVDHQIIMDMDFEEDLGVNRATINKVSFVGQKVPTLYTVLSAPKNLVSNPVIYGQINPFVLKYGDVVEIVLKNADGGHHPWHMHGHAFQVIARSAADTPYDPKAIKVPRYPMRRDTIQVKAGGYTVLRFKADNPGVFLFHCHIEWHVEAGLVATLIEAPEKLQEQSIPHDHYKLCQAQNIPTKGNAAGNTKNFLDLTGANTKFDTDNWGALVTKPSKMIRRIAKAFTA